MHTNVSRILVAAAGAALVAAPLAAYAQPSYAPSPSYAARSETITGTISSVQNVNHLIVADDRGFTDDVTLRSDAQVLSYGARLEPGQRVTIVGSNGGRTFVADRISTHGPSYAAGYAPVPAYYPAPVYYAPVYAYRPYYPVSVGLFFHFR